MPTWGEGVTEVADIACGDGVRLSALAGYLFAQVFDPLSIALSGSVLQVDFRLGQVFAIAFALPVIVLERQDRVTAFLFDQLAQVAGPLLVALGGGVLQVDLDFVELADVTTTA